MIHYCDLSRFFDSDVITLSLYFLTHLFKDQRKLLYKFCFTIEVFFAIRQSMNLLRSAVTTIFIHICYLHVCRLQFVPLILSMIVCLTQLCRKSANKEDNRKTKIFKILSKFEFLWQLPYIQFIRHFILWNDLRKAVLKKQKIFKICNVKGMALLHIVRTTKLVKCECYSSGKSIPALVL